MARKKTAAEKQRADDDKVLRTKGIVGTSQKRAAFRTEKASIQRKRSLERMTPAQREKALDQEGKAKSARAAKEKRAADDKVLRTKGIVGTKEERAAFRTQKKSIQRERALERMTPAQREKALDQEGKAKGAKAAQEKRAADDKVLRTKSVVGTKEERAAFREQKTAIQRERALERMTPAQREKALDQEQKAKGAKAAQDKRKADDKTRRTVGKVGNKEEREKFRADKARVKRDDALAKMTPKQREEALKREAAVKAAEAQKVQQAADEKALRTVAKVGSKEEREAFHAAREGAEDRLNEARQRPQETRPADAPRSAPPIVQNGADTMRRTTISQAWAECETTIAMLA